MFGLPRSETDRLYDSIVELSGLAASMDLPVKTYSSGMYMRLGFSVTTHLDADLLLIDEILAVGDEAFHQKCIERSHRIRSSGRTIVMVSHDLALVEKMCDRVCLLVGGRILVQGEPPGRHRALPRGRSSLGMSRCQKRGLSTSCTSRASTGATRGSGLSSSLRGSRSGVACSTWSRSGSARSARRTCRGCSDASPSVRVHTLIASACAAPPSPTFPGWPLADRINGRLLRRRVARWMREAASREPIVWIGVPSQAALEAARGMRASRVVYDCLDRFDLFHEEGLPSLAPRRRSHPERTWSSATSADLFDRMRVLNPRTSLLPNAADYDHFAWAAGTLPAPPALLQLPRPILGYVGEIAPWFDVEAVAELAASHPTWSLVLVGPLHSPAAQPLLALRNVHHLGRVGYEELPRYVGHFDACLLPFRVNPLTQAASPVKLYEYLASGKPVASAPLNEVLPLRGLVEIAEEGSGLPRSRLASRGHTTRERRAGEWPSPARTPGTSASSAPWSCYSAAEGCASCSSQVRVRRRSSWRR